MKESKNYSNLFDDDDFETEEDRELDADMQVIAVWRLPSASSILDACARSVGQAPTCPPVPVCYNTALIDACVDTSSACNTQLSHLPGHSRPLSYFRSMLFCSESSMSTRETTGDVTMKGRFWLDTTQLASLPPRTLTLVLHIWPHHWQVREQPFNGQKGYSAVVQQAREVSQNSLKLRWPRHMIHLPLLAPSWLCNECVLQAR